VIVLAVTGLGRLLKVAFIVVLAGTLYIASGAPIPQTFEKRVAAAIKSGDVNQAGTFANRAELIAEAWDATADNIFYGMGADKYREFSAHGQPVHNLLLLIWNEGGAPAYVGLMLLLSLLVIFALAGLRERREDAAMALAVVCVFLIYTMSIPHMYSRFWVLPPILALSTIYARRQPMGVPMWAAPQERAGTA
jgi:O-antigen ligase